MQTAELENPALKPDDIDDAAFLEAARKADAGQDFELPKASAEETETRAPVEDGNTKTESTSNTDTLPEKKDERPRDELGRFTKTETGEDIPEAERKPAEQQPAETAPAKEDSAYAKALKERERQQNLLANFEKEKQEFRQQIEQERARLAAERQQIEQARQPQGQQQGPKVSSSEFTKFAKDCAAKARELRIAGDFDAADEQADLATKATERALQMAEQELQTEQQNIANHFEQSFIQEVQALKAKHPELANPQSELTQEIVGVMDEYPIFERIPPVQLPNGEIRGGAWFAYRAAELSLSERKATAKVSVLEQQLKQVTAERDAERQRTGMSGSGPSSPAASRSFDSLSEEQQDAEFLRMARELDAASAR